MGQHQTHHWNNLPHHIIVRILSYLDHRDRHAAAVTCKRWAECFANPSLWELDASFWFYHGQHAGDQLNGFPQYAKHLKSITIYFDKKEYLTTNVKNVCKLLTVLSQMESLKLEKFAICADYRFLYGRNKGNSLAQARATKCWELMHRFLANPCLDGGLREVDFSGLPVANSNSLVNLLANMHSNIHHINLQNDNLSRVVSRQDVVNLVHKCRKLVSLEILDDWVTPALLTALADDDRAPLQHLSLVVRGMRKRATGSGWEHLTRRLPYLKVSVTFISIFPLQGMPLSWVLSQEIPLVNLNVSLIASDSYISQSLRFLSSTYQGTLEDIAILLPPDRHDSLLRFLRHCHKLKVLCCANLNEQVKRTIHELYPSLEIQENPGLRLDMGPNR